MAREGLAKVRGREEELVSTSVGWDDQADLWRSCGEALSVRFSRFWQFDGSRADFFLGSEHDELRFSIRSVLAAFPPSDLRTLHLIVGDTPSCSPDSLCDDPNARIAQIPHWLDLDAIDFAGDRKDRRREGTGMRVWSHWEIFRTALNAEEQEQEREAEEWRASVLPSFTRCETSLAR